MNPVSENVDKNLADNCPLLICSCDKNLDILFGNLQLLKRFWSDCPFAVYVLLEKANPNFPGVTILHATGPWSNRVIDALHQLDKPFVLFSLDDYWIEDKVENSSVLEAPLFLQKNPSVFSMVFSSNPECMTTDKVLGHFSRKSLKGSAVVCEQFSFWRVSSLLKALRPNETAWESEIRGSERAKIYRKSLAYCIDKTENSPIRYNNGWLVVRGRWNLNEVERLESKLEISIDLTKHPTARFFGDTGDSFFHRFQVKATIYLLRFHYFFHRKKEKFL